MVSVVRNYGYNILYTVYLYTHRTRTTPFDRTAISRKFKLGRSSDALETHVYIYYIYIFVRVPQAPAKTICL